MNLIACKFDKVGKEENRIINFDQVHLIETKDELKIKFYLSGGYEEWKFPSIEDRDAALKNIYAMVTEV